MSDKVNIQELDPSSEELLNSLYKDRLTFARFGDIRCFMPRSYKDDADNIRSMAVRPDDVWVVTFPRSAKCQIQESGASVTTIPYSVLELYTGTTWTQELVWLLMNDFDYVTAAKFPLMGRYFFLEVKHVSHIDERRQTMDAKLSEEISKSMPTFEMIVNAPSPRFIKTHVPFSLLPQNLLDTTKVVYVARDPRDVAVSFYHHNKLILGYSGDFKSYWNLFLQELGFSFVYQAIVIKKYQKIVRLCEHLDINNFRKNESVNPSFLKQFNPDAEGFVRKGKSGAWRENFDEEMAAQAQRWMRENLAGTDLRFPDNSSNVATLISLYGRG